MIKLYDGGVLNALTYRVNNIFFATQMKSKPEARIIYVLPISNSTSVSDHLGDMIVILTLVLALFQRSIAFRPSFTSRLSVRARGAKPLTSLTSLPTTSCAKDSLRKQIYCNVALNGSYIEAVGFDLSYTLAQVINQTTTHCRTEG